MEKNYILNLWASKPRQARRILREEWPELHEIVSAYAGKNLSEKAYKFFNNLPDGKMCEHCGNPAVFLDFRRGYTEFCGAKCVANSSRITQQKQNTLVKLHGVTHYSKTAEYKKKFTDTCQERYGVNNPGQISGLKEKRSRNKQYTFFTNVIKEISEFSTPKFTFDEYTFIRDTSLPWECVNCETEFTASLFGKIPKCKQCYPSNNRGAQSSVECDILNEIKQFYHGEIIENSRLIIPPQELDMYFPDKQFAIEVNGIYWHSSDKLDKMYHQQKFNTCNQSGISILMVTDYEWKHKRDLVLNMIKHRLGIAQSRIHTRKCILKVIDSSTAKLFLNNNHVNGFARSSGHLGLYFNNTLVSVLSYATRHRFKTDHNIIEIVRLAFSCNAPGALGKFIKYLQNNFIGYDIISYADLRYGVGNVYIQNNFVLSHMTSPGYWYLLKGVLYHRLSWTKQRLVKLGYPSEKTEQTIMAEMGALRIYDCGHYCYNLNYTKTENK